MRVKRVTGAIDTYEFRGTDNTGPIYVDSNGHRHTDVGEYIGIAVDLPYTIEHPKAYDVKADAAGD